MGVLAKSIHSGLWNKAILVNASSYIIRHSLASTMQRITSAVFAGFGVQRRVRVRRMRLILNASGASRTPKNLRWLCLFSPLTVRHMKLIWLRSSFPSLLFHHVATHKSLFTPLISLRTIKEGKPTTQASKTTTKTIMTHYSVLQKLHPICT